MKKWTFITLLLAGATVLGATVFREPIAWAAQSVDTTIVGPLDNGNVRVHEEGTANVREQNLDRVGDIKVHEQGTVSTRSDNDEVAITQRVNDSSCVGPLYQVPAGKKLVVEYIGAWSGDAGTHTSAWILRPGVEKDVFLPLVLEPQGSGARSASQAVHYVVSEGVHLWFAASNPYSGSCDFEVSLGGHLQ
jgi:hypothetical protein